ncbi:MAG: Gfo/Idh/MocA family oxidoreductase [Elusimicrobia bacterium]|nr:Gfo/Idh/MocA family oxidoreductase [Elusimicrobiota bacterium]
MKVLILGTGSVGQRHMRNLASLAPGIRFVVARETGAPNPVTDAFAAEVFPSIPAALREAPDFSVIATPPACHREALEWLVRSRVPFYVEKPVAASMDGLRPLLEQARAAGLVTLVGCNLRFLPSLVKLRRLLQDGACGRIVRAHLECGQWLPDWRPAADYRKSYAARRDLGGGVLLDLIHEVDMARWLFGEFERVDAHHGHFSDLEIETDDAACVLLSRRGGPVVSLALDYVARHPIRQYRVVGALGTLEWDLPGRRLRHFRAGEGWREVPTEAADFDLEGTYLAAMRHFLRCLEDKTPTSQPFAEGLASLSLALEAAGLSEAAA